MQTASPQLKIAQAYIYFSQPSPTTLNFKHFEENLIAISGCLLLKQVPHKLLAVLINNYHHLVAQSDLASFEEYLMIKFIQTLQLFIQKCSAQPNQQICIIALWSAISHLKKTVSQCHSPSPNSKPQYLVSTRKDSKQVIHTILNFIKTCIGTLKQCESFSPRKVYPQVSAMMMNFVLEPIDHLTFRAAVAIMEELLQNTFDSITLQQQLPQNLLSMHFSSLGGKVKLQPNQESSIQTMHGTQQQRKFKAQFVLRFQAYFQILIRKAPNMQAIYKKTLLQLLERTKHIFINFHKLLIPFYMVSVIVGASCDQLLTHKHNARLSKSTTTMIRSAITEQWIAIASLSNHGSTREPKNSVLKRLLAFSPFVDLSSPDKCDKMAQLLLNKLFLFHNEHSLVVPHHPIIPATHLPELKAQHSFSSYPNFAGILTEFQFECNRVLVNKLPYTQMNLESIELLGSIINHFNNSTIDLLLQQLLSTISDEETKLDTSLTKFCQFLTKIVVIYYLVHKGNHGSYRAKDISIVRTLFDVLTNTQAIRILQPSFKQEELVIGFVLLICYDCYLQLLGQANGQSAIVKLKHKLTILEITLNNSFEGSYLLKLVTYHILLKEAAPHDVQSMISNLQTVLINRNIHHIKFIIALIQLSKNNMTENECENLAQRFIHSLIEGSEELLRILLNRLSQNTIRKCLLVVGASNGKWVYMLSNNTQLLYNRAIEQRDQTEQTQNFYMNDGPNVTISNALGVTILQLGDKWEYGLLPECPYKQATLGLLLEMIEIGPEMVIFKARFSSILRMLFGLLGSENEGGNWPRIVCKIYQLLDKIPAVNMQLYIEKQAEMPASQKQYSKFRSCTKKDFSDILVVMEKLLKQSQIEYLMNPKPAASQAYELRERVAQKIATLLSR